MGQMEWRQLSGAISRQLLEWEFPVSGFRMTLKLVTKTQELTGPGRMKKGEGRAVYAGVLFVDSYSLDPVFWSPTWGCGGSCCKRQCVSSDKPCPWWCYAHG